MNEEVDRQWSLEWGTGGERLGTGGVVNNVELT